MAMLNSTEQQLNIDRVHNIACFSTAQAKMGGVGDGDNNNKWIS